MQSIRLLPLLALTAPALAQWHLEAPPAQPAARIQPGATYDPLNARTIVFGGAKTGFGNWNDTWAFDGHTWTQLAPTASPSARGGIQLVYDSLRNVIVMYGGLNASPFGGASIDQTWEFDGTTWTQIATAHTPGGLGIYGMAYDSARNRTVLYGGIADNFFPIDAGDTWEYDGVDWVHVVTANSPGPLENMGMCYNPVLGKVVLYGGIDVQVGGVTTTWGYDGTNWTVYPTPAGTPGVRTLPLMVFDSSRGTCLLHGGMDPNNGTLFNDTWEFDGLAWVQWTSASTPVARRGAAFAFDDLQRAAVLFGGVTQSFGALLDTWHYGALVDSGYGAGCPGSSGVPILAAPTGAQLGGNFQLQLANLVPSAPAAVSVLGFAPLAPTDLTFLGLPGCTAYCTVDDIAIIAAGGGNAARTLAVPNLASLAGAEFFTLGFSFDAVNTFGGVISNTMRCLVGF